MLESSIVNKHYFIVLKRQTLALVSAEHRGNLPPPISPEYPLLRKPLRFGSSSYHHQRHAYRCYYVGAPHHQGLDALPYKTSVSSSPISYKRDESLLQALCQQGHMDAALDVLGYMDSPPSTASYLALLKECNRTRSLTHVKQVCTHLFQFTGSIPGLLADHLVMTLANCGAVEDAHLVSNNVPCLTVFSWTAIISAYVDRGCGQEALKMYDHMLEASVEPSSYTFVSLFRACGSIPDLNRGKELQRDAHKHGFGSDMFVGTALLSMYSKCGAILEAEEVLVSLAKLDVVSCNAMLSAFVEHGEGEKALLFYRQIEVEGIGVDQLTIVSALQACSLLASEKEICTEYDLNMSMVLEVGRAIHVEVRRKGYTSDCRVSSALVSMYGWCGSISEAEHLFCEQSDKDAVSWNAMLSAYTESGQGEKALQLYKHIQEEGISSNPLTYVIVVQACGTLVDKEGAFSMNRRIIEVLYLKIGHALHCDACKKGYISDVRVGTALINMYSKCRSISEASATFCTLSQRDIISWNAVLAALVDHGHGKKALQLYRQMHEEGTMTNQLTFRMALQACISLAENEEAVIQKERMIKSMALEIGQALHSDARRKGYASDVLNNNTLLGMYCRSGALPEAHNVFYALSQRDVVSWNVMLSVYVEQGQGERVFRIFEKLQEDGVTPDSVTYSCIMQACCDVGSLETLCMLHFGLISAGFENVVSVASCLFRAYAACARMVDVEAMLDMLPEPDLVSWNTCIAGHAGEGNGLESTVAMEKLKLTGLNPDEVSFSSLLVACTHTGLVVEGVEYFESMKSVHRIAPDLTHYGNVVDLLGRAGDLKRLEDLRGRMLGQFDLSKFVSMLSACRIHNNIALAKRAFDEAVNVEPDEPAVYVLMSNICAGFELQESA